MVYLQCLCFDVSLSSVVSLCYNACPASCVKIKFLLKICTNMCSYQSTLMIQTDNWTASICPGKLDNSFCVGSVLHIWGGDLCGELSASHNCPPLAASHQYPRDCDPASSIQNPKDSSSSNHNTPPPLISTQCYSRWTAKSTIAYLAYEAVWIKKKV